MMARQTRNCLRKRRILRQQVTATFSLALASVSNSWAWMPQPQPVRPLSVMPTRNPVVFPRKEAIEQKSTISRHFASSGIDYKDDDGWEPILPYEDWSHNSARITIPPKEKTNDKDNDNDSMYHSDTFLDRLDSTIVGLKDVGKSSIWIDVPMSRASLIEVMEELGFAFHHAEGKNAVLNLWLMESENMVPEFATHHVGVGAMVINSRNEILCIRELHKNYMPWKIPGGLSELGENIHEAAEREVYEETGVRAKFRDIVSFRHSHGLANGRSDLYFICRLDPVEEKDENGNWVVPEPVPQEGEIESAAWVPFEEYQKMVDGEDGGGGHPMYSHALDVHAKGHAIEPELVDSVIASQSACPIYAPKTPS